MGSSTSVNGWALEVVRGEDVGRLYALNGGSVVLGNALGGAAGIDLADQEWNAPRRMAAQQATLECSAAGLVLRDLDSPGGTFVNRQRVLSGQARPLREGDLIQLGGVQLRVVARTAVDARSSHFSGESRGSGAAQPASPRAHLPFRLRSGPTCRSWDDFLTVSAQRWGELREELTSGRLAAYLTTIGRTDLAPPSGGSGDPDERLDAWIATLPTTRPSRPELDVHPAALTIRVAPGGSTQRKVRVANAGHRLLRVTSRVEPAGTSWLALPPEFDGRPITIVEATDLPLVVTAPERLEGPLRAEIVIESNGGTTRLPIAIEPVAAADAIPEPVSTRPAIGGLASWIRPWSGRARFALAITGVVALRGVLVVMERMLGLTPESPPHLASAAFPMAVAGGLLGIDLARRRGTGRDLLSCGFAGAFAGVLMAAPYVAACRTIEPARGGSIAALAVWAVVGAIAAGATLWAVPPGPRQESAS